MSQLNSKLFEEIISKCGVTLNEEDDPHVLKHEEGLIIEQLGKTFKDDEPKLRNFVESFKKYCFEDEQFRQTLLPSHIHKTRADSSSTYKIVQESLMGILLRVDSLQIKVVDILMDRLHSCVIDETYVSWIKLITDAMKSLPFFKDIKGFTTKLLEAIEIGDFSAQLEILTAIPAIMPEDAHDAVSSLLINLLNQKSELNAVIIECLNSLNMSNDCKQYIVKHILKNMQTHSSLKCFPILFEFIISDCPISDLPEVLMKCRDTLAILLDSENFDLVSIKSMAVNEVIRLASVHKHLLDEWLKTLNNVKTAHVPIDMFLFMMLHESMGKQKSKSVEALFKKRVISQTFHRGNIENSNSYLFPHLFDNHSYVQSLIKLIYSCFQLSLQEKSSNCNVVVSEFLCELSQQIFSNSAMNEMNRRHVLHSLMVLVGQKSSVKTALAILRHLCQKNLLIEHQLQIMGLLEFVNDLSLLEVRQVFEIMCQLTCTEGNSYKDEVHMFVRKQLSSCKHSSMQVGIIAAIAMANSLASCDIENDEKDVDITDESIDIGELPSGPVQDAATLLSLARTTGRSSPELLGLFYDQIAHMVFISADHNSKFVQWLFSTITNDFQDVYVIEKDTVEPVLDLPLKAQLSLNTTEELPDQFSVNIAGLTNNSEGPIIYLSPFFRTLRLLHIKLNKGDLSNIDALLGSAILMPPLKDVEQYSDSQIGYICDCLFHCINWFREIISAFINQTNKSLRFKLLDRVLNIIDLENLLREAVKLVPDHKLPNSYFHELSNNNVNMAKQSRTSKAVKAKKKATSNEIVASHNNITLASTSLAATPPPPKRRKSTAATNDRIFYFRELDTDLINLLKYKIKFDDEVLISTQQSQSTTISLKIFRFVLMDFVDKMRFVTKNQNPGLSVIGVVKTIDLVNDCQKSIPRINHHFLVLRRKLKALLQQNDDRYDVEDMHTETAAELKHCYGLCLEFLYVLFSWSGFQETTNLKLWNNCVKSINLNDETDISQPGGGIVQLTEYTIKHLAKCSPCCMYLDAGVHLLKVMQLLNRINGNTATARKRIVTTSHELLSRRWYDLKGNIDSGRASCDNLEVLIKVYLEEANVKTLLALVGKLQSQVENLHTKDDYLFVLGSIDMTNFHILFQCVCATLKTRLQIELKSATNSEHLALWKNIGLTMQGLITISKTHKNRYCYKAFMISSTAILKMFISSGIPIFEIMLRGHTDQVVEILRIVQTTTRFVHNLCCEAKEHRDTFLLSKIPTYKCVLETLIYKVKALLVANDYSAAFWMGNLKNRNLDGDVILSQSTVNNDKEADKHDDMSDMIAMETDEELFNENESSDILSERISNDNESVESEVY